MVENISEKENFEIFYENFTTDSVFQISRIIFPLEGEYVDYDNVGLDENEVEIPTKYLWTKKTWNYLYKVDTTLEEYIFETKIENNLVIKIMYGKGFGFYTEERYKLISGKWYLIYYIDKNM